MDLVVLKVLEIFDLANKLCDDGINHNILLNYFNKGVNAINNYANLKLPLISSSVINSELSAAYVYDVSIAPFVNNTVAYVLVNFIAKTMREVDGYSIEANEFASEYASLLVSFSSKYKETIKQEYQLGENDGGNLITKPLTKKKKFLTRSLLY